VAVAVAEVTWRLSAAETVPEEKAANLARCESNSENETWCAQRDEEVKREREKEQNKVNKTNKLRMTNNMECNLLP
jgi:hypothetical protein